MKVGDEAVKSGSTLESPGTVPKTLPAALVDAPLSPGPRAHTAASTSHQWHQNHASRPLRLQPHKSQTLHHMGVRRCLPLHVPFATCSIQNQNLSRSIWLRNSKLHSCTAAVRKAENANCVASILGNQEMTRIEECSKNVDSPNSWCVLPEVNRSRWKPNIDEKHLT